MQIGLATIGVCVFCAATSVAALFILQKVGQDMERHCTFCGNEANKKAADNRMTNPTVIVKKLIKNIFLWAITIFFALMGLVYLTSGGALAGLLATALVVLVIPIDGWQRKLKTHIRGAWKPITTILLVIICFAAIPPAQPGVIDPEQDATAATKSTIDTTPPLTTEDTTTFSTEPNTNPTNDPTTEPTTEPDPHGHDQNALQELFAKIDAEITLDEVKAFCEENELAIICGSINDYIIIHTSDDSWNIHRYGTADGICDNLKIWIGNTYPKKILRCEYKEHLNGMTALWYSYSYDPSFNMGGEYIGHYLINPNTMNHGIVNEHGHITKIEPQNSAQEIINEMNEFDYDRASEGFNIVEDLFISIQEDMTYEQIKEMALNRNLFVREIRRDNVLEIAPVQAYNTTLKGRMTGEDCFGIIVSFDGNEADSKINSVTFNNPVQDNVYKLTGTYYVRIRNAAYNGTYDTEGYGYYIHNPDVDGIVIYNVDGSKTETNLLRMDSAENLVRYIKEYKR